MARPQATDYAAKQAHICLHAAACFAALGYPSASMSQIAIASGVSKAGLYHYYDSKESVLFDVLDGYVSGLFGQVKAVVAQDLSASQTLHTLIESLLTSYATAQYQHRVLITDTQHLSNLLRERVHTVQRHLVRELGLALQAAYPKRINARNASAHAMMVFGMLNWTFTWLKTDGDLSYADYAQQVIATLERGLRA
jgi:AcrR family transcriptional regulator